MRKTLPVLLSVVMLLFAGLLALAENAGFHSAPDSAKDLKNPYEGKPESAANGKPLYHLRCARCHGENGEGSGNIPALRRSVLRAVTSGELFWFISKGDLDKGMPSWANLPRDERWRIVSYVKTLSQPGAATTPVEPATSAKLNLPLATGPFTDFRTEQPGQQRKITPTDLPEPYATKSAENSPRLVSRPANAWPKAPAGFKVELFADHLDNPRLLRTAPNGDIFLAEMDPGKILVFRGMTGDGKPAQTQVFASGLKQPYGIAFYPPGPDPQWLYIGMEGKVVRYPYRNGDLGARGRYEELIPLPTGGHSTRSLEFSPDGKTLYVAVGSESNVADPDTTPEEKNRADILAFDPSGQNLRVFASGIRNAGGGLALHPKSGELWCSVNERDGLGDNLVPDYITHVQENGFYGWPWWYMGGHQDPRHKGKHPELKDKAIVPDVLLQAHNASLQLTFYESKQFPAEYQGDIFAAQHGSWNKSARTGYEVIRIPLHHGTRASGDYQDFITGFVLDSGDVWGRPVGVTVAPDGSLLVSDDGSNSIWRVRYTGK
jgi:glucose/arabinose dehydrogenase